MYRNYPLQQSGTAGCCNLEDDLGQPTWILLSGLLLTPPITPHVKTWMVSGRCSNLHSPTFFLSDDDWRANHRRYIIRISQVKVSHANRYEAIYCEAMQRTYKARTGGDCKRSYIRTTYYSYKHQDTTSWPVSVLIFNKGILLAYSAINKRPAIVFCLSLNRNCCRDSSHRHHLVAEPDGLTLLTAKPIHTILSHFHLSLILTTCLSNIFLLHHFKP